MKLVNVDELAEQYHLRYHEISGYSSYAQGQRIARYEDIMMLYNYSPTIDFSLILKDLLYFIEDEHMGASKEIIEYIKNKYNINLMDII